MNAIATLAPVFALWFTTPSAPAEIELMVQPNGQAVAGARYRVQQVGCDGSDIGARRLTIERSGHVDKPHPLSVAPGCYRVEFDPLAADGSALAHCEKGQVSRIKVGSQGAARVIFQARCAQ